MKKMTQITKEQIINASAEELKGLARVIKNVNCNYCTSCNYCKYCKYCYDCDDCYDCTSCTFCTSCTSCNYCYKSQNQEGKQFVFCNVQLSKNEYFDAMDKVR